LARRIGCSFRWWVEKGGEGGDEGGERERGDFGIGLRTRWVVGEGGEAPGMVDRRV